VDLPPRHRGPAWGEGELDMQDLTWRWFAAAVGWLHGYGLLAPMVQLLLVTLFGFIFAERWQRWRQRRDFQYRTLVKFSELSYEMINRASELLMLRGAIPGEEYIQKRLELLTRWTVFAAMRGEIVACYGHDILLGRDFEAMISTLNTVREYVRAPERVPEERFEPQREKYLAHRAAVVADMIRATGLVSRRQYRAERRTSEAGVRAANLAAARAGPASTVIERSSRPEESR
jgi:hypothetical protein